MVVVLNSIAGVVEWILFLTLLRCFSRSLAVRFKKRVDEKSFRLVVRVTC